MTTNVRVQYRSGNKHVKVYRESKHADGTWHRFPDSKNELHSKGDELEQSVWDTQRIVIEEFGEFTS